ncbi:MAG: glycosyl transferase, partial [Desulfamplus sp.]|nr:glycosyl transferase [Desulfamplus sp.]
PLHEAIIHNETGRLVDFFDVDRLARSVCELLDNSMERSKLGANAREFARGHMT